MLRHLRDDERKRMRKNTKNFLAMGLAVLLALSNLNIPVMATGLLEETPDQQVDTVQDQLQSQTQDGLKDENMEQTQDNQNRTSDFEICQVQKQSVDSLQNQIDNIQSGGTITLTQDILDQNTTVIIPAGKEIKLALNQHKIEGSVSNGALIKIEVGAKLTVTGTGTIHNLGTIGIGVQNQGKLILANATIQGAAYAIGNWTGTQFAKGTYQLVSGNGVQSDDGKILVIVPLATPSNIQAVTKNYNQVDITWTAVKGAQKYVVYRMEKGTTTFKLIGNATTTKYVDKNVVNGKIYCYKVAAYAQPESGTGEGTFSSQYWIGAKIAAPTNVKAKGISYNQIQVTWTKVAGASKYLIYRAESKTGNYKRIKTVSSKTNLYSNTKINKGKRYYYKIFAVRDNITGLASNIASTAPKLGKVKSVKVSCTGKKKATLTWKKTAGAKKYVVYRSTSKTGTYTKVATVSKLIYTNRNVRDGKKYYYKVVAVRDEIVGRASGIVSFLNPTKIKLNKSKVEVERGKTVKLKVSFSPSNVTTKTIKWTSSDKKVATVSKNGVVTGKKAGKAVITATAKNGKIAKCTVTVTGKSYVVAIDAGHQRYGNSAQEPIGPGASETKPKVSSGTAGCVSGWAEYQLNLVVAQKLKAELIARGYEVVMIRESHDVDLSNSQRAQIANDSGADVFVRIHANSSTNSSTNGILTMSPSAGNPYVGNMYQQCYDLSSCVLNRMVQETNANNMGVYQTDSMSGINWCKIPVTIVEMGYMSNPTEDSLMATDSYQNKLTTGIANGLDDYFNSHP